MIKNITYWTSVIVDGIMVGDSLQFDKACTEPTTIAQKKHWSADKYSGTPQIKISSFGSSGSISAEGSVQGKTSLYWK